MVQPALEAELPRLGDAAARPASCRLEILLNGRRPRVISCSSLEDPSRPWLPAL